MIPVSCMVVAKACFALLIGLDVLKPQGGIIDLKKNLFTFDNKLGAPVTIALTCERARHMLEDVRAAQVVGCVRMLRPIPAEKGPKEGQITFPELDEVGKGIEELPSLAKASPRFPQSATVGKELTEHLKKQVWMALDMHKEAFDLVDGPLPCTDLAVHHIETGKHAPIYVPPYRYSKVEEGVVQTEVDKLVKQGIVRESKSPWGTSTVLVAKKDGERRLCIDF